MEFILSLTAAFVAMAGMLALSYIVYQREKTLLEINEKYKKYYNYLLDDWGELKRLLISTDNEKEAYRNAIYDCIENFNATYSNTRLSFDEDKCAFVIEDIDVDDSLTTEEEITQQTKNNDENQQSI